MKYSSRNLYALSLVFLFSVFTNTGLAESLSEQLDECKIIKVSLIRLQCYDRISNQTNKKTAVKTKKRLFNLGMTVSPIKPIRKLQSRRRKDYLI